MLRHPRVQPLVTAVASLMAALLTIGILAAMGGCGSAAQRTVTAAAVASVAIDDGTALAYETIGDEIAEDVAAEGGGFADWCIAMEPHWTRAARAGCAARALADLAFAGQALIDADATPGRQWAGAACGILRAVEDAWGAAEDPPAALVSARGLACALSGGYEISAPACDVGPVPGCEEVE